MIDFIPEKLTRKEKKFWIAALLDEVEIVKREKPLYRTDDQKRFKGAADRKLRELGVKRK
jgi:hypothetical protein